MSIRDDDYWTDEIQAGYADDRRDAMDEERQNDRWERPEPDDYRDLQPPGVPFPRRRR